jgi:tripartite-type tricarboxylate transporter receptor subunit TctC
MYRAFRGPALALGFALTLLAASASAVTAADATKFYKSRSLTIAVPNAAGGGYDTYVRALAQYLGRHIPGNPAIVVQNIPAAGGLVMANQLYVMAPKDGTYIGMVRGTVLEEELLKNSQVQFEGREFNWLANMNSDVDTCIVSSASGINTISDLYIKQALAAATGVGAQSYTLPLAYRKLLGMKFKIISGYSGTPDRILAMQRGEVDSACGITVSTFESQVIGFARAGKVRLIAQAGLHKDRRFPNLPNMLDEAKTPEAKGIMRLLLTPLALGRPIAAPPGTPPDKVVLLRKAIIDTLADPDFQAVAKKVRIDVQPMTGEETARAVDSMSETSIASVARLKSIIGN